MELKSLLMSSMHGWQYGTAKTTTDSAEREGEQAKTISFRAIMKQKGKAMNQAHHRSLELTVC